MPIKPYLITLILLTLLGCSSKKTGKEVALTSYNSTLFANDISNSAITSIKLDQAKNWIHKLQSTTGLLVSTQETDFVSLYDNALAGIFFIYEGKLSNAEEIFNYYNTQLTTEFTQKSGGFYQTRTSNGNNVATKWLGDNAWLLIALNHYQETTGSTKYNEMATSLEKWIRNQQDVDGGLWGGFRENGETIPKISEGIITAFNAVKGYDSFHKNILKYLKNKRWEENEHSLIAGPENPKYKKALDLHSLGYLIFEDFNKSTLKNANYFKTSQLATGTNKTINGYSFDQDNDVVWLEGTAQMAVSFAKADESQKSNELLKELNNSFIYSNYNSSIGGIPYASNLGSTYGANKLWQHADKTPALSSTIWYIFANEDFNPFYLERYKNIPESDKFWMSSAINL